ncbi:MAG: hypothetical protein ABIP48_18050 [Planctomycetota bacterium]
MSFEIHYQSPTGYHAEVVDAWDNEDAVIQFRHQHAGQGFRITDVIPIRSEYGEEVAA